ncbi:MAG: OprO/OprP family phosphate-selective porin [Muribaculaceae bacterium]|nr:OprO/OprP family phosphate-selective porin [Muribaculaceae bacterium]
MNTIIATLALSFMTSTSVSGLSTGDNLSKECSHYQENKVNVSGQENKVNTPNQENKVNTPNQENNVNTPNQGNKASDSKKEATITFRPAGRIFFDGALFAPDKDGLSNGVTLPDTRLGGTATFGKFSATIMMGYGMGALSAKDIWIGYAPDKHNSFRLGYFIHQFGLDAGYTSAWKSTMINPVSDSFFKTTGFNIGVRYIFDKNDIFVAVSLFTPPSGLKLTPGQRGKISVGAMERFAWRPFRSSGEIAQIGFSSWYQTPEHTILISENGDSKMSQGYFDFSANFPTLVNNVTLNKATINNAKGLVKLSPDILLSKDRFAFESQYYFMNVTRNAGLSSYKAHGVYAILKGLIIGDRNYSYSHSNACLATPGKGTLEWALGYDYTNASDHKAGILGGISNDYSVTLNYYLNKYITCRLRYSYTTLRDAAFSEDRNQNIIQARVMFLF